MEEQIYLGHSRRGGRTHGEVIAPDVNLLLYCLNPPAQEHRRSLLWWESALAADELIGIPNVVAYALVRFITNPKIVAKPVSFEQALELLDSWLSLPHVRLLYPGDRHWSILSELSRRSRLRGAQITDAVIAAIAVEYGAVIYTHDSDFARFPGVRWHDPLA